MSSFGLRAVVDGIGRSCCDSPRSGVVATSSADELEELPISPHNDHGHALATGTSGVRAHALRVAASAAVSPGAS